MNPPMEFESSAAKAEEYERQTRAHQAEMRARLVSLEDEVLKTVSIIFTGGADARWLAIGKTRVEEGFMALQRAVHNGRRDP